MQLEAAKAELRSRPHYEAADLGLLLLRALFRPALHAWLGFVLPLQLGVILMCWPLSSPWAYLGLWWLKPLYDRAFGLVLGQGLFGDAPALRPLYRALWKDGRRALLGDLSFRRLDPARTLVAPVSLLEGLAGKAAGRRRRTLGQGNTVLVWLVAISCLAIELGTLLGLFCGAWLLLPQEADFIAQDVLPVSFSALSRGCWLCAYVLALGLVEPLFVAAGFGLYINRRTEIEGWDVELTFRRMARRLVGAAALTFLIAQCPILGGRASAQPAPEATQSALDDQALRLPAPEVATDGEAAAAMARVLARPDLQRTQQTESWELRSSAGSPDGTSSARSGWWAILASALARGAEILLWVLAALALVVLVYVVIERMQTVHSGANAHEKRPEFAAVVRSGHEATPTVPLADVVPKALALLAAGEHVAALSVLYVGTLTALMRFDGLTLPAQATEGQCLAAVRTASIAPEHRTLFTELTELWQLSAYAHTPPEHARLQDICARFLAYFGGRT